MEKYLTELIKEALEKILECELENVNFKIDKPKEEQYGDFSSNAAMVYAKQAKTNPRALAQKLIDTFDDKDNQIEKIEIAGPGFINFYMKSDFISAYIKEILSKQENFGKLSIGKDKKINIEFVSSNPTGPLHIGHGRQAVLGDVLCNVLDWAGYEVTREYYYNDAGNQMNNLGLSLKSRYADLIGKDFPFPEDGYQGEYIIDIAKELYEESADKEAVFDNELSFFRTYAADHIIKIIDEDLKIFGIKFDVYFLESSLYQDGKIEETLEKLRATGKVYDMDGAVWLKATDFGFDKDKVLVKSSGEPAYILPDIAYHANKYSRKFDKLLDIQGADHHAQTHFMKLAMMDILGYPKDSLDYVLHQMVAFVKNGEEIKISTRKNDMVTLRDLINEIGKDVTRYFFVMRSSDSHLVFDFDLALKKSNENPAYYIQYAHARLCSIMRKAEEEGFEKIENLENVKLELLDSELEKQLVMALYDFPGVIKRISENSEVHLLPNYLQDLAGKFHSFYQVCRVLDKENEELSKARLALTFATKIVIKNGLTILGITSPERM